MVLIPKSVIHLNYLAHPVAVGAKSLQDNCTVFTSRYPLWTWSLQICFNFQSFHINCHTDVKLCPRGLILLLK